MGRRPGRPRKTATAADQALAAAQQGPHNVSMSTPLPLGPIPPEGYLPDVVSVRFLTLRERRAFKRLMVGLTASKAKLATGQPVLSGADAVRWLLDQVAEAHEQAGKNTSAAEIR